MTTGLLPLTRVAGGAILVLSDDAALVASNTLTAISRLSQSVVADAIYSFTIILWITATFAEGWQLDLNGGSAAMSWIQGIARGYDILLPDGSLNPNPSLALLRGIAALATNVSPQDAFSGIVEIKGSFVPLGNGTFIPRIAQLAHSSGNVTVLKGSLSKVEVSA